MQIPVLAFLLQGIPEHIAMVTLAFALTNRPIVWQRIIGLGLVIAIVSYTIRLLPFFFGIHTLISLGLLVLLLVKVAKASFINALMAGLVSALILIVAETVFLGMIFPYFDLHFEQREQYGIIGILMAWPQILTIFGTAYGVYRFRSRQTSEIKA